MSVNHWASTDEGYESSDGADTNTGAFTVIVRGVAQRNRCGLGWSFADWISGKKMKNNLTKIVIICVALLFAAASLRAGNVTVTNTNDALSGSLRQAIQDANPNDIIGFNIPATDPGYNATTDVYTINLTSVGLTIDKSLTITGFGSRVVVRRAATAAFSIFGVLHDTFVALDNLTIANGSQAFSGGGIDNLGVLVLSNCTFVGNHAGISGGGLFNAPNVVGSDSSATIKNCTFTANNAPTGGAIENRGTLELSDSTLSGNDGSTQAGGLESNAPGTAHVRNTIVAGNTGGGSAPDVFGSFISDGYNFIGVGAGTGFGNSGSRDQVGTVLNPADPKLGPLFDHAGSTQTMAPLFGSPAIDQGSRESGDDFDQRGFPRPVDQASVVDAVAGDGSDIGAVELAELQPGPNFTVTTTDDHDDAACGPEDCTLREALSGADENTISFAPDIGGTITNTLSSTGFAITKSVTINGPGARLLTISGGDTSRCLKVTNGTVVIHGLSFAHGSNGVDLLPGGGIQNGGGATLTLNDCTFSGNNAAEIGGPTKLGFGGAIGQFLAGQVNINRCTFADNSAGTGGGGLGNLGGTVVVTNSTFTRNSALIGGAIASSSLVHPASLDLRNSTVAGNDATGAGNGGGVTQLGGTVTVTNSIIAGNTSDGTAPNVSGTFVSQGSNVIGDPAGGMGFIDGTNGDQVGVSDPKVGALGNFGGPTDTLPLLAGSAAIDQANPATAPERDQRSYVRLDIPDVGAFEFKGTIPVTLANISTRLKVETGDNVLIGGFIVTGIAPKKVFIRGLGASLPLAGKLANPTLELFDSSGQIAANDNWKSTQKAAIEATTIPPTNDLESAIVATLPANNSAYTAILRGVNDTTGIGQVEIYDLDRTVDSKLANISTRGLVQTGDDVIIGGFIVVGPDSQKVIIRAIGPSLPVAGKLANPTLELHDEDGAVVTANDDWRSDQEEEIIATGVAPTKDKESAIVRTLTPGAYTAIVRGVGNTTGIALVEVFGLAP